MVGRPFDRLRTPSAWHLLHARGALGPPQPLADGDHPVTSSPCHLVTLLPGTAALHLSLEAVGIQEGDEVILPTLTFAATAEVVRYFDAKPVLVDVDPRCLNIDPTPTCPE